MIKVLSIAEMRAADAHTINNLKIPSEVLMARAGRAIAEVAAESARAINAKKILVVCGTGNNGGDGYVAANILSDEFSVEVLAVDGKLSDDCAREKSRYSGGYGEDFSSPVIIDCLFGTGLTRPPEGKYPELINKINSSGAFVISADIPSGLNGGNGKAAGCAVKADITVAVAELKTGYFLGDGPDYCGKIIRRDIGITCPEENYAYIFEDEDFAPIFPKRKRNSNKGTYGSAELLAGSEKYTGAAALALSGALKSGCGYVKLACCEKVKNALVATYPQSIFLSESDFSSDCIAAGMGLGATRETYEKIANLIRGYDKKLIIDADGLNSLAMFGVDLLKEGSAEIAITPHLKEFSRLSGLSVEEIEEDPISCARAFSKKYGCIVLLKSSVSVLSDGRRTALLHKGNSALSKGGSGDMLSGLACGIAARGIDLFMSLAAASYVLGDAAEMCARNLGEYCTTAQDIIKNLHFSVKRLTSKK